MEKEITKTLRYFAFFSYAPTLEELYIFLEKRCTKAELEKTLQKMAKKGQIKKISLFPDRDYRKKSMGGERKGIPTHAQLWRALAVMNSKQDPLLLSSSFLHYKIAEKEERYTLGEYSIGVKNLRSRIQNSLKKLAKSANYIKLLSLFPQIQLIGISGSVAMLNARETDDIDLFIITQKDRLWIGRCIALALAQLLRIRRPRLAKQASNKICLNLFFSQQNLSIPNEKRSIYMAHEVLQMKPVISKNNSNLMFLSANKWVFGIFPNAKNSKQKNTDIISSQIPITRLFGNGVEFILKSLQLFLINRHRTTEIISDTQLWFFPDDFAKRLNTIQS